VSPSSERLRAQLEALRAAPGPVQVVAYSAEEIQERALAEALAAARALGRAWRRGHSRARRLELLAALGVHVPAETTGRSAVDALIKTTLTGGFQVRWMPPRQGQFYEQALSLVDPHEPFELIRRIPSSSHGERRSD
jgi:hypothetical protein